MLLELRLVKDNNTKSILEVMDNTFSAIFDRNYYELFFNDWNELCKILAVLAIANFNISMLDKWSIFITNPNADVELYIDNYINCMEYKLIRKS